MRSVCTRRVTTASAPADTLTGKVSTEGAPASPAVTDAGAGSAVTVVRCRSSCQVTPSSRAVAGRAPGGREPGLDAADVGTVAGDPHDELRGDRLGAA